MEAGPHIGFRGQMRLNCPFLFTYKHFVGVCSRHLLPRKMYTVNRGALFRNSCINVWHCMATFPPKKNGDIVKMEV